MLSKLYTYVIIHSLTFHVGNAGIHPAKYPTIKDLFVQQLLQTLDFICLF